MNFTAAAQHTQRRLLALRALHWWRRHSLGLGLVLLLLAVHRWYYGSSLWPALVCTSAWLAWGAGWAWLSRPDDYAALAYWGGKLGVGEDFAAAWSFEQQAQRTNAQQQHWAVQQERLVHKLAVKVLPLKFPPRLLWPLLAGLVVSLAQQLRPLQVGDELVNTQALHHLQQQTQQLAQQMDALPPALNTAEQAAAEILKNSVAELAAGLNAGSETSSKQLLSSVEKQARDAERLAQQLAATATDSWASAVLLSALDKQVDTAVLAESLAKKAALPAMQAVEKLAQALANPATVDATSRSIQDSAAQADSTDPQRVAGRRWLDADKALRSQRVDLAMNELQALAQDLQYLAKREQAQQQLQALADSLREAAAQAAGQASNSILTEVESTSGNHAESLTATATENTAIRQLPSGESLQEVLLSDQPLPQSQTEPKATESDEKTPLLLAPVPGQTQPAESSKLPSISAPNVSNDKKAIARSGAGLAPSNATAPLKGVATQQQKAQNSSTVTAASGNVGTSSVRQTAGSLHNEQSQRQAPLTTSAQLQATQEAALNDLSLPPSRRAQVQRYLTQLRKQLEKEP